MQEHDDTSAEPADASSRTSRRMLMTALGAAVVGATVASPEHADATSGTMLYGTTNDAGGSDTVLTENSDLGQTLRVQNTGTGGAFVAAGGNNGWGAFASGRGGVYANGHDFGASVNIPDSADPVNGYALRAFSNGSAPAVVATCDHGPAVRAFSGSQQPLILEPNILQGQSSPPDSAAEAGTLYMDHLGRLLLCVASGHPGTWRIIGANASAGAWFPLTPGRVHDSRAGIRIVPNAVATVFVGDSHTSSGAIDVSGFVPLGATAVSFNLTVTLTVGSGYLAVLPGDVSTSATSTINWFATGQTFANASLCKLDDQLNLNVRCGGPAGAGAHFIVDVTGYYM